MANLLNCSWLDVNIGVSDTSLEFSRERVLRRPSLTWEIQITFETIPLKRGKIVGCDVRGHGSDCMTLTRSLVKRQYWESKTDLKIKRPFYDISEETWGRDDFRKR